jgi:hypothetical protein
MLYISHWKSGSAGRGNPIEESLPEWAVLHRKRELESEGRDVEITDINGRAVSPENLPAGPAF